MDLVKLGQPLNRAGFRNYLPTATAACFTSLIVAITQEETPGSLQVDLALERVRSMKQDANAGAYYKAAQSQQSLLFFLLTLLQRDLCRLQP